MITVWVFGDQLNRAIGALANARPDTHRVLIVESRHKIESRPWHRQRLHLYIAAMRRFAAELRAEGFEVDHRVAPTMRAGLEAHVAGFAPTAVLATEPNSFAARGLLTRLGVEQVRSDQFLCHPDDFAVFTTGRKSFKMEDFYRWQRRRLGVLMDGDEPVGGRWNFDDENREPPPRDGHDRWPTPPHGTLDDLDRDVIASLPEHCVGAEPTGMWATTRDEALGRLRHFVDRVLPLFGPHEDAMLAGNWHLAHSVLSPYLNLGLLLPGEVVRAAEDAYRAGAVPIASAEGFIRQVVGWREYVWNLYWREMPDYASRNALGAARPLPPAFTGDPTSMRCVSSIVGDVHARGWVHHIPRLMVLGNLALIAGVDPQAMVRWMSDVFVDAAEWVMVPNLLGMSLYADGGVMATKPYAAGGAYIDRMSDYCGDCTYDRTKRVGDDACPFTTLYWDFLLRHEERFVRNPRVSRQVHAARRLADVDALRMRAADVLGGLDAGRM